MENLIENEKLLNFYQSNSIRNFQLFWVNKHFKSAWYAPRSFRIVSFSMMKINVKCKCVRDQLGRKRWKKYGQEVATDLLARIIFTQDRILVDSFNKRFGKHVYTLYNHERILKEHTNKGEKIINRFRFYKLERVHR